MINSKMVDLNEALIQLVEVAVEKKINGNGGATISSKVSSSKDADNDIIRIEEASELTGLKPSSIYTKVCKGELPHFKQFGKLFFRRSELLEMIKSGRRKTPNELQKELDEILTRKRR